MLEWLKSAWEKWRVQVTVVGGVLVVATAYGTCSYDPQAVSEAEVVPPSEEVGEQATNNVTAVPASNTTGNTTETETTTETTTE